MLKRTETSVVATMGFLDLSHVQNSQTQRISSVTYGEGGEWWASGREGGREERVVGHRERSGRSQRGGGGNIGNGGIQDN